ncbi:MAG: TlpA family protein disulfide reductase [Actinomycetia bacterium]|jgi:thiol-disulfide isomerase/thioredoxin|nr:TlpA family protein disulfide reductase [Actinomycetes bacterium]
MPRKRPTRIRVLLVALGATAFVAAGCTSEGDTASDQVESSRDDEPAVAPGGGDDADGGSDATPDAEADSGVPADAGVVMTDVATGESVPLDAALASSDGKPVLAWFWAPYCPTCRGEAPELNEFMASNSDRVKLVGIGARNDLEQAEGFLSDTGVSNFPLLWDPTGQSWVDNAVAAQPYMILLVDGEEVERWPGGASVRQIEDALAQV